jgi:hypothetical protein
MELIIEKIKIKENIEMLKTIKPLKIPYNNNIGIEI